MKNKKTNRGRFMAIMICFLCIVGFMGYEFYISAFGLTTTYYKISSPKITENFRITQLTDLHNSTFGKDNEKLVEEVKKTQPDLILITGDLVNDKEFSKNNSGNKENNNQKNNGQEEKTTSIATSLIKKLSEIAPVYFSYGNQEDTLKESYKIDINSLFQAAGATVLDDDYMDIEVNGQQIRLGGFYGYCQPVAYGMETHRENETEYLMRFQDTDRYKILMCHMPVCWMSSGSLYDYYVDTVFSGHAHGGQVIFPLIGGLYGPDQGWFPGKLWGVFSTEESHWKEFRGKMAEWAKKQKFDASYYENDVSYEPSYLVLSRGLGNTDFPPRFNNIPEIVVVDFK
ncbi:MAG: metallophosphoesterase [Eubacteriales bacterium]|nr:metallophosphoesterase [Eubacteriales bacterium]